MLSVIIASVIIATMLVCHRVLAVLVPFGACAREESTAGASSNGTRAWVRSRALASALSCLRCMLSVIIASVIIATREEEEEGLQQRHTTNGCSSASMSSQRKTKPRTLIMGSVGLSLTASRSAVSGRSSGSTLDDPAARLVVDEMMR